MLTGVTWRGDLSVPIRAILRGDGQPAYELHLPNRSCVAKLSNGRILDELAKELRAYLASDRLLPASVCTPLSYLVDELMADKCEWGCGTDAIHILDEFPMIHEPDGMRFHGTTCSFSGEMEPLFVELKLAQDRDSIASYDIRIGDAAKGLQRIPCGKRIRNGTPEAWLYTFTASF